ncbi:hypothetical protein [Pelosinus sp. sgz500959]|uniref:hypothetical protein n=1 Tax=Pelosinus sp. sgz500959 TaxID=3242472 RepID=UPI003672BE65
MNTVSGSFGGYKMPAEKDIVHKQKIVGNSKNVTLGDPKDFSNRRSDRTTNTQMKPQRP